MHNFQFIFYRFLFLHCYTGVSPFKNAPIKELKTKKALYWEKGLSGIFYSFNYLYRRNRFNFDLYI